MAIKVALNHITQYDYDHPIELSPHVVRLKPAPHCRTPILSYTLRIEPADHFINWQQDPFGNYQARLVFPHKTRRFRVEVDLVAELTVINPFDFFVDESAENFPFHYSDTLLSELGPYLQVDESGAGLQAWIQKNKPPKGPIIDTLVALNQSLQSDIGYRVRMEPGVQSCEQTLSLANGSCRDSGWLMVQILRQLGMAARFVSGYLVQLCADEKALDGPSGPIEDFTDLHAWAEVFLPGAGWVGLDPTSGLFAGEGHIPLSCTPQPTSAAPITGMAGEAKTRFTFRNTVRRIDERPRVTRPLSEEHWQCVLALGAQVDAHLAEQDVRLTMGGEPTFVSLDDQQGDEWNSTALSEAKLDLASKLMLRLRERFAPHGLPTFTQGKWYPGEPTPRWALSCHWRLDGLPLWHDMTRLALPGTDSSQTPADARRLGVALAGLLGIEPTFAHDLYEDPLYHLHLESMLPEGDTLDALDLKSSQSRRTLARRLSQGLDESTGLVLPLRHTGQRWISCAWPTRRGHIFLVPGDSPAGLRLPLDSIEIDDEAKVLAQAADSFTVDEPLPPPVALDAPSDQPAPENAADVSFQTALVIECREGLLHAFMPPVRSAAQYLNLLGRLEQAATACDLTLIIEGYEPPRDARLELFRLTPDPGVIEVNIHPAHSFADQVEHYETLYAVARETRLSAEKFLIDGRHTGTGGGNHMTLGGPTPADSPFLRRPSLLRSLITWWQHHPSLSYLFSGLFIGPTSQAPRVDEARTETVYELEMALSRLPEGDFDQPWLVDRLLRHMLIDVGGNTHRAEICIDKLYSPDGPAGRQGLVELRAFEMPPHARMAIVQALLVRCLISRFWQDPYQGPLVRWGTELHDRFMLPHYLWADMLEVIDDLKRHGFDFDPAWLEAFFEFRFPQYGVRQIEGITLELRAAIEPWHVLGEEASAGGMARYVDSSMERLQLKVGGLTDTRHVVTCNGRQLRLRPTGTHGEYVVGVRYRAWQPPSCLHPDLPVDTPLVIDVLDTWNQRSLGGCAYHVAHPGGRSHDDVPVNANVAEARRLARFEPDFHTPASATTLPVPETPAGSYFNALPAQADAPAKAQPLPDNADYPYTADLRLGKNPRSE